MKKLFTKHFWLSEGQTSESFKRTSQRIEKVDKWIAIVGLGLAAYCLYYFCTHATCSLSELINNLNK